MVLLYHQIDETNYPGANMRFFEIPAVGGKLAEKLDWILSRPDEAAKIRRAGHEQNATPIDGACPISPGSWS